MKPIQPYILVGSAFILLLAFQNCGQAPQLQELGSDSSGVAFHKSSVEEFSAIVLTDPETAVSLDVNLHDGQVRALDQRGYATGARFCLKKADRELLEDVLKGAEVCEPVQKAQLEERCLMIYEYPYAQLRNANREVNLGEKHHGCEIPADLCGEKSAELRQLASRLLAKIPESSCE